MKTPPRKGRGALSADDGRFEALRHRDYDDGWDAHAGVEAPPPLRTQLSAERAKTIISRNDSPDIPFRQSLNPYRGCEHGCIYCYARPTHAYYGFSPGLDFETQIVHKPDAPRLLREALSKPGYRCEPLALGNNTDVYQPVERRLRLTRQILEVLSEFRQPFTLITKSALVERDLDLIAPMAEAGLAQVMVSITGLDPELSRRLEPRAASPQRRLQTLRTLADHGVPCGVMFAPVIPALNDADLERVLRQARETGAVYAGYVMLRLPLELENLFSEWLRDHAPLKAAHVLSLLRQSHGGEVYQSQFGQRMRGSGVFADLIAQRFRLACARLGFNKLRRDLDCDQFRVPPKTGAQLGLF